MTNRERSLSKARVQTRDRKRKRNKVHKSQISVLDTAQGKAVELIVRITVYRRVARIQAASPRSRRAILGRRPNVGERTTIEEPSSYISVAR